MGDTERTGFWTKALASLATTAGLFLLPMVYLAIETYGPSSRVEYFGYLFSPTAINYPIAGLLGAWLGATLYRWRDPQRRYAVWRLAAGCVLGSLVGLIGSGLIVLPAMGPAEPPASIFIYVALASAAAAPILGAWLGGIVLFKLTSGGGGVRRVAWLQAGAVGVLVVWLLLPQFRAFPQDGTPAQRDAWAVRHVPEYASLKRTVGKIPVVTEDVGRIVAIAPTRDAHHIAARDMDGVGMNFTLEVVGDKGSGVLRVQCGVDGDEIYSWEPGVWIFNGQIVEITTVANLVRRGG